MNGENRVSNVEYTYNMYSFYYKDLIKNNI